MSVRKDITDDNILHALRSNGGNCAAAARKLGMSPGGLHRRAQTRGILDIVNKEIDEAAQGGFDIDLPPPEITPC